jgi:hypothetical protein
MHNHVLNDYLYCTGGSNRLLWKKSQKAKGWSFSYAFLKLNAKEALSTTLLFEKCQKTDFIFFLSY